MAGGNTESEFSDGHWFSFKQTRLASDSNALSPNQTAQPTSVYLKAELFFQEIVSSVWIFGFLRQSHWISQADLELTV